MSTSAVLRGRAYEAGVLRVLSALGMRLSHVGGRSDGGIDLLGTWGAATGPPAVRVAVQCKRIARPCPPSHVRELEGAVRRDGGVLAVMACSVGPSEAAQAAVCAASLPMLYLHIPVAAECDEEGSGVGEIAGVFASVQTHALLPAVSVATRHTNGRSLPVLSWRTLL